MEIFELEANTLAEINSFINLYKIKKENIINIHLYQKMEVRDFEYVEKYVLFYTVI